MAGETPRLLRWKLGGALRDLRERSGRTIEDVVRELQVRNPMSAAKISRIETGKLPVNPRDVSDLCALYGADEATTAVLLQQARESRRPATEDQWWHGYPNIDDQYNVFIELESVAARIRTFEAIVLPGLLQTPRYAAATSAVDFDPDTVAARVQARLRRQERLTGPGAVELVHAVIDENMLHRPIGEPGDGTLLEQLEHLYTVCAKPNIRLQILARTVGYYPGMYAPAYTLLENDEIQMPKVCYVEGIQGNPFLEQAVNVEHFESLFNRQAELALSPDDSRTLIKSLIARHRSAGDAL